MDDEAASIAATPHAHEAQAGEDFSGMGDPEFLAERRRVREELEHTLEGEIDPELAARNELLDEEFLRRASLAWATVASGTENG